MACTSLIILCIIILLQDSFALTIGLSRRSGDSLADNLALALQKPQAVRQLLFAVNDDLENLLVLLQSSRYINLGDIYNAGCETQMSYARLLKVGKLMERFPTRQLEIRNWLLHDLCLANWPDFWKLSQSQIQKNRNALFPPNHHNSPLNYLSPSIINHIVLAQQQERFFSPFSTFQYLLSRAADNYLQTRNMSLKAEWCIHFPSQAVAFQFVPDTSILLTAPCLITNPKLAEFFLNNMKGSRLLSAKGSPWFMQWSMKALRLLLTVHIKNFQLMAVIRRVLEIWFRVLRSREAHADPASKPILDEFVALWGNYIYTFCRKRLDSAQMDDLDKLRLKVGLDEAFVQSKEATFAIPFSQWLNCLLNWLKQGKVGDWIVIDGIEFYSVFLTIEKEDLIMAKKVFGNHKWSVNVREELLLRGMLPISPDDSYNPSIFGPQRPENYQAYLATIPFPTRQINFNVNTRIFNGATVHILQDLYALEWLTTILLNKEPTLTRTYMLKHASSGAFNDMWLIWTTKYGLFSAGSIIGTTAPHFWVDPVLMLALGRFFLMAVLAGVKLNRSVYDLWAGEPGEVKDYPIMDLEYFQTAWNLPVDERSSVSYPGISTFIDLPTAEKPPRHELSKQIHASIRKEYESDHTRSLVKASTGFYRENLASKGTAFKIDVYVEKTLSRYRSHKPMVLLEYTLREYTTDAEFLAQQGMLYFVAGLTPLRLHFTALEAYCMLFPRPYVTI